MAVVPDTGRKHHRQQDTQGLDRGSAVLDANIAQTSLAVPITTHKINVRGVARRKSFNFGSSFKSILVFGCIGKRIGRG